MVMEMEDIQDFNVHSQRECTLGSVVGSNSTEGCLYSLSQGKEMFFLICLCLDTSVIVTCLIAGRLHAQRVFH